MSSEEVQNHLEMHRSNSLPLTPITTQPSNQDTPVPPPASPPTVDTSSTSSSPPSSLPLSTPPPKSAESLDSQTLPDTQNPMSPLAPSPPSFSPPPEANAALMRRFLDVCGNTPTPTIPTSPLNPATPSPAIPPLMANIISKKRAAHQVFGDESPSFYGTIDNATTFFTETFGPRDCDTTKLLEELAAFVLSAAMDQDLFTPHLLTSSPRNCAPWQTLLLVRTVSSTDISTYLTHSGKSCQRCSATASLPKMSLPPGRLQPPS